MPIHCKIGDTDVFVVYSFGGGKQKTIKIKTAPIKVETKTLVRNVPPSEQIENQFYNVNFTLTRPNYAETVTDTIVLRGKITGAGVNANEGSGYNVGNSWGYNFYIIAQGFYNGEFYSEPRQLYIANAFGNPHGTIIINWIAPLVNQESICTIEIYYNEQRIYYDEGTCPLSYEVTCEQKCPPGTTKCFSTNYPGYCCIPCSEIKNEIKAIASQIRSINNG